MDPCSHTLLTAAEVAARLNIAKSAAYALAVRGNLPHYRVGRLVRFREEDLVQFLKRHRVETLPFAAHHPYVRLPQA